MPNAARVGDLHVCPTPGTGPVLPPGSPTVLIDFLPAARLQDLCVCLGPPDAIISGAVTVLFNGQPAARIGDSTARGGKITTASATVVIGGPSNGPFDSQDDAARAALGLSNSQSIQVNREFGGLIYRGGDGKYYYSGPVQGTDQGFNPSSAPAPPGTSIVGDYHTHGDYSTQDPLTGAAVRTGDPAHDDFNSDQFSGADKIGIAHDGQGVPGYSGYLGTPSGTFRKYDPATGSDTTL